MHSRIFQVSMTPIEKTDYINESNYYDHWFTRTIADYVSDSTNRAEDINWLSSCNGIVVSDDENEESLIVINREEYFKNQFNAFKEAIEIIKDFTITEFANGSSYDIWKVNNAYEDKYGFYVDEDGELVTLDEFIRTCALNTKYYIGGTVDYHY